MERVYYLCVDCCEARTSSFLPELLADRREVVVERSCCLLLGHCRTPKQKQTGLIPEKMIVTRTGSNPNELKEVATYLERGFPSYLLYLPTSKRKNLIYQNYSTFSIQSSRRKLKGSIAVPFLCDNSPPKQRQLWEYKNTNNNNSPSNNNHNTDTYTSTWW